jgi:MFS family permease
VQDSAFASLAGSLYGGVILVGFALALGAGPLAVGVLAALPLIAQALQLPAIALVERLRRRRAIVLVSVTAARACILALALIPWALAPEHRLPALIAAELAIAGLGSIAACALNSWLHQLLPREGLGRFFARRLFWGTAAACVGALAAGLLVDRWPFGDPLQAYAFVFAAGALAGFLSSHFLAKVPEPRMENAGPRVSTWEKIRTPFRDRNFRRLIVFVGAWNIASNLAAPFIAVYLMRQLAYSISTVTVLTVSSQLANAFTLYAWGRVSDRLSNKGVLAAALPVYFASLFALIFAGVPEPHSLTLPLLFLAHVAMGAAAGGIGLATGNLGLKLAPSGQGTAYLAAVSLTVALAGGIAPMLGGAIAEALKAAELSLVVHWSSSARRAEFAVLRFEHWEFLFAISTAAGFYVMHALSRLREEGEVPQHEVVQALAMEGARSINQLSSIGGLLGGIAAFGRLLERRLVRRG